jgi:hypothetical protein
VGALTEVTESEKVMERWVACAKGYAERIDGDGVDNG